MRVIVWIVEGTWTACVDAARNHSPADADIVLLHVLDEEIAYAAHAPFAGLLGRSNRDRDPAQLIDEQMTKAAHELLMQAEDRLGRPCTSELRSGRVEREVVEASQRADLLIVARDGDRTRLGPKSLGRQSRFIVDHAPCTVLLLWPEGAPGFDSIPPAPRHPHPPPHR
jgi:nucleotide-binding universal stress UspA family protein